MTGRGDGDPRFAEVEETFAATLRFPGGRMANFFASFGAAMAESYTVLGSKGALEVSPGYSFETARRLILTVDGKSTEQVFPHVDNFSGQVAYFSDCILNRVRPEADGEEGLADVVIMCALEEAARTGRPQPVSLPPRSRRPGADTLRPFPYAQRRLLVLRKRRRRAEQNGRTDRGQMTNEHECPFRISPAADVRSAIVE